MLSNINPQFKESDSRFNQDAATKETNPFEIAISKRDSHDAKTVCKIKNKQKIELPTLPKSLPKREIKKNEKNGNITIRKYILI